ncbi:MAG: UDP-N-acetylmuramoyl-tripeptide--D-alanyl-D-alanine ligase [Tissierellia bacterium]|nr:UDP-N-acetylmuramoyl-tripeptide--D-alanyl-D-alanine ligase [Tissierellia bacterium]
MLSLTLGQIAELSGGQLNNDEFSDIIIDVVSIDTRTLNSGEMYMPIIGEKLDGHLFIKQAFDKGAAAVFSEKGRASLFEDKPIVYVENSNEAFARLATNYRNSLKNVDIIGITGSNGKTSTKDLIALVFSKSMKIAKTIGNLNNEIGVPRTLLRLSKETELGVVEMGTDGFGQIDYLSRMVKPNIAILTNVGDAHLHILKSKDLIAREKLDIVNGLSDDGYFIYNYDDEYIKAAVNEREIKQKTITFGQDKDSDYVIEVVNNTNNGSTFKLNGEEFRTSKVGLHQVYNATCAIIVAKIYGLDKNVVKRQLEINETSEMRSELISCQGFDILNDSYKSNPQSLLSALDTLDILSGYKRKIAILGDMLELGDNEELLHREIGREIDPSKVDYLLLTGPLSKFIAEEAEKRFPFGHVFYAESKDILLDKAKYLIQKNSLVLVKASRSIRLEEIVEALEKINVL